MITCHPLGLNLITIPLWLPLIYGVYRFAQRARFTVDEILEEIAHPDAIGRVQVVAIASAMG
jgi:hypothetical protein